MTECSSCLFIIHRLGAKEASSFSLVAKCMHLIGKGHLIVDSVLQQCVI